MVIIQTLYTTIFLDCKFKTINVCFLTFTSNSTKWFCVSCNKFNSRSRASDVRAGVLNGRLRSSIDPRDDLDWNIERKFLHLQFFNFSELQRFNLKKTIAHIIGEAVLQQWLYCLFVPGMLWQTYWKNQLTESNHELIYNR